LLWRRSWNQEPTPNTIHWPSSDHAGANAPVSPVPANLGSRPAVAASKMRFRLDPSGSKMAIEEFWSFSDGLSARAAISGWTAENLSGSEP
jgi:hypothetical protein